MKNFIMKYIYNRLLKIVARKEPFIANSKWWTTWFATILYSGLEITFYNKGFNAPLLAKVASVMELFSNNNKLTELAEKKVEVVPKEILEEAAFTSKDFLPEQKYQLGEEVLLKGFFGVGDCIVLGLGFLIFIGAGGPVLGISYTIGFLTKLGIAKGFTHKVAISGLSTAFAIGAYFATYKVIEVCFPSIVRKVKKADKVNNV